MDRRGSQVASCAWKCLKPLQSTLHCPRLPKWNTLNTHSKVWKQGSVTMTGHTSTSHFFLSLLSAFPVSFLYLSLASDSSSNVCLKSCGSLGEGTRVNLRKSLFWSEENWGNGIVFTNHENVGLHRQSRAWQKFMHWCFPHFGVQIKECQPQSKQSVSQNNCYSSLIFHLHRINLMQLSPYA